MAAYVILSKFSPEAFRDPADFKKLADDVSQQIKQKCPGVVWKQSFATMGRFDVVDIVESDDPKQIEKDFFQYMRRLSLPAVVIKTPPQINEKDFAVRQNQIHGRACDDLGGVAAILAVLVELKRKRARVNVIGVISRAEEVGFQGALTVAASRLLPKVWQSRRT